MARIRMIKPEFWQMTYDISEGAALLFIALLNFADDYGIVELDPALIKENIYPRRNIRIKDILTRVEELRATDRIYQYLVNGMLYGKIVNFLKHQAVNRRSKHKFPAPPAVDDVYKADGKNITSCSANAYGLIGDHSLSTHVSLSEYSVKEEKERSKEKEETHTRERETNCELKKRGEFVELSDDELVKLSGEFGKDIVARYIKRLDTHIGSTGSRYRSHFWTLRKWMIKDIGDSTAAPGISDPGQSTTKEAEAYRAHLLSANVDANERFRLGVINPLRDELSENVWQIFIEPLVIAKETCDMVILFTLNKSTGNWIKEHFLDKIQSHVAGRSVTLTSKIPDRVIT